MCFSYRSKVSIALLLIAVVALVGGFRLQSSFAAGSSFIGPFNTIKTIASTVPHNGDVNPYGIVVVPRSIGRLTQGDILISNFNNKANLQGREPLLYRSRLMAHVISSHRLARARCLVLVLVVWG